MEEEKGFTVKDKRRIFKDEGDLGSGSEEKKDTAESGSKEEHVFTELTFSTFILSLSTSVLVNLGELPDPLTNEKKINLPLAKQTISIIEMLMEKTKGNLTQEEDRLISNMLYDLRMEYVSAAAK
ncbi:MAG: DUF1844 domain-containing protein [Proteobacteria bacterium]|jgi:hypothetical protein|nr:DUF1844 domain-containing protein [Pseudomonadota bacterium]